MVFYFYINLLLTLVQVIKFTQLNITFSTLKFSTMLIASPIWSKSPCADCRLVSRILLFIYKEKEVSK